MPKSFTFDKPVSVGRRAILGAKAVIRVDADPRLARALAADEPLPLDADPVRLADVELGLKTGQPLVFDGPAGRVAFSAGAGARAGLGVYADPADMLGDLADLGADGARRLPLDEIPFPGVGASRYFVLHWGYDLRGQRRGLGGPRPGNRRRLGGPRIAKPRVHRDSRARGEPAGEDRGARPPRALVAAAESGPHPPPTSPPARGSSRRSPVPSGPGSTWASGSTSARFGGCGSTARTCSRETWA